MFLLLSTSAYIFLFFSKNLLLDSKAAAFVARLRRFATSLLESIASLSALSVDDLSTARCACLLSMPLSVFASQSQEEEGFFRQLAHLVASASQLASLQGRSEPLSTAVVSAVDSWLDGEFYPVSRLCF